MKKIKKLVPVLLLAALLAGCGAPAAPAAAATPPTTMAETLPEPTETTVRETEAPAPARILPDGCYTVDFETEETGTVTVRDRDTMEQKRIPVAELKNYIEEMVQF